jgi:hypothetical protein
MMDWEEEAAEHAIQTGDNRMLLVLLLGGEVTVLSSISVHVFVRYCIGRLPKEARMEASLLRVAVVCVAFRKCVVSSSSVQLWS